MGKSVQGVVAHKCIYVVHNIVMLFIQYTFSLCECLFVLFVYEHNCCVCAYESSLIVQDSKNSSVLLLNHGH